jgi:hypothetical protein
LATAALIAVAISDRVCAALGLFYAAALLSSDICAIFSTLLPMLLLTAPFSLNAEAYLSDTSVQHAHARQFFLAHRFVVQNDAERLLRAQCSDRGHKQSGVYKFLNEPWMIRSSVAEGGAVRFTMA